MRALEVREQLAAEAVAKEVQNSIQLNETLRAHEKQLAAMMDAREQQLTVKVTFIAIKFTSSTHTRAFTAT